MRWVKHFAIQNYHQNYRFCQSKQFKRLIWPEGRWVANEAHLALTQYNYFYANMVMAVQYDFSQSHTKTALNSLYQHSAWCWVHATLLSVFQYIFATTSATLIQFKLLKSTILLDDKNPICRFTLCWWRKGRRMRRMWLRLRIVHTQNSGASPQ